MALKPLLLYAKGLYYRGMLGNDCKIADKVLLFFGCYRKRVSRGALCSVGVDCDGRFQLLL